MPSRFTLKTKMPSRFTMSRRRGRLIGGVWRSLYSAATRKANRFRNLLIDGWRYIRNSVNNPYTPDRHSTEIPDRKRHSTKIHLSFSEQLLYDAIQNAKVFSDKTQLNIDQAKLQLVDWTLIDVMPNNSEKKEFAMHQVSAWENYIRSIETRDV
jgi:hypothetical protein